MEATRNEPNVTRLFFANDSLLFCHARKEECNEISRILHLYEQALW